MYTLAWEIAEIEISDD